MSLFAIITAVFYLSAWALGGYLLYKLAAFLLQGWIGKHN